MCQGPCESKNHNASVDLRDTSHQKLTGDDSVMEIKQPQALFSSVDGLEKENRERKGEGLMLRLASR